MNIDIDMLVSMTDANRHLSNVIKKVDDRGMVVILKNNKPRYVIIGFEEYEEIQHIRDLRAKQISEQTDRLITE